MRVHLVSPLTWRPVARRLSFSRIAWAVALMALVAGLGACASTTTELSDRVEVPKSDKVTLTAEVWSEVSDAMHVINNTGADPIERAEAYLYIADVNLYVWDELQREAETLDETQGARFEDISGQGRIFFMQAHRARARAWADRTANTPEYIESTGFGQRFAEAWELHREPASAYGLLAPLLGEVILAKRKHFVDVDFLSDLRYSTAIFYTLQGKTPGDMPAFLEVCQGKEAQAVRLAGDIAFLYERLVSKPESAAESYRAIAQAKPQTREGYEAQVSVLETLRQQQRHGAMQAGGADTFDASSQGMQLFETVNRDLDVLVELSAHKSKWKDDSMDSSNLDARSEELVRQFTVRMHGLAQQQDSAAFYTMAVSAYENYHALFPSTGYAYQMRFFQAEALYKLGRYEEAYQQYKNALGTNPHGQYREDIVRSLVMTAFDRCRAHALPTTPYDTRTEMPEAHRDFISSGEQFISALGEEDPDMAGFVRYEVVLRHYLYGELRAAEAPLEHFVKFESTHPQAKKAAILWLDLLAREALRGSGREVRAIERAVERIRSTSVLIGDEDIRQKIDEVSRKPPYVSGRLP